MMDAFKSIVTVEYIHGVKNNGWDRFDGKLLQRDYFEHIIRDEQEYQRISDYIINNPSKWKDDKFYNALGRTLVVALFGEWIYCVLHIIWCSRPYTGVIE